MFIKTYWAYAHHFNVCPGIVLCDLLFHLIYCPSLLTSAYCPEMASLSALCAHLAICQALLGRCVLSQYLHDSCDGVLCCAVLLRLPVHVCLDTFIISNSLDSVIALSTVAWVLCASTLFAYAETLPLVVCLSLLTVINSLIINSNMLLSMNKLFFQLCVHFLIITLYCCDSDSPHPLFYILPIIPTQFSVLQGLDCLIELRSEFTG